MAAPAYDILDVERVLEASFEAFCAQFEITGREARQQALKQFAAVAKEMKGRQ